MTTLLGHSLAAHGRNTTAVRAEIEATGADITIRAVVLDLLQAGNLKPLDWERLEAEDRASLLRDCGFRMGRRFGLLAPGSGLLAPDSVIVEVSDLGEGSQRLMTTGQQQLAIRMRYTFDRAPEELIFAQEFSPAGSGDSILAQILVYRAGELVLLPAQFGPGLPLSCRFDWKEQPADISRMTSLDSVAPNWRNRPACLRLIRDGQQLLARAYIPLNSFQAIEPDRAPLSVSVMAARLSGMIRMRFGNREGDLSGAAGQSYPCSILAIEHGEVLGGDSADSGLLVLEKRFQFADKPGPVKADTGIDSGPLTPMVVVIETGQEMTFSLLNNPDPALAHKGSH